MGSTVQSTEPVEGCLAAEHAEPAVRDLAARHFQLELFELAAKQNVIICLGTGSGKTLIAVLLIKKLLYETTVPLSDGGRRTVFLAPTVPLVQQQAAYIARHIAGRVRSFVGAMRVDDWSGRQWSQQFEENNVLVMTPTILNNILNANFISMANLNLLVFDECHCATGKDPYVQIMQNHYICTQPSARPRVLGLTASVFNKKVRLIEMASRIEELECKLGANLVTALSAVDYITRPHELLVIHPTVPPNFGGEAGASRIVTTPDSNVSASVNAILAAVGPFGCLEVVRRRVRQLTHTILSDMARADKLQSTRRLHRSYELAEEIITGWNSPIEEASPKAWRLLEILEEFKGFGQPLCGIIFTVERATVFALCRWIQAMAAKYPERWGHLYCDFVIGQSGMALYGPEYGDGGQLAEQELVRHQERVLRDFRSQQLNLLVATSVIEEGVDVPACNLVVRFDAPRSMRSYVQSRGRARRLPSLYVVLANPREALEVQYELATFKNIEFQLLRYCNEHRRGPVEPSQMFLHLYNRFQLANIYSKVHEHNNGRAVITPFAARQILQWYCDSLGSDRYTLQTPEYTYEESTQYRKLVRCSIRLPRQSPLQTAIFGDWEESHSIARTSAALNALNRLYAIGELSQHMLPIKRKVALEVTLDEVSPEVASLFKTGPASQTNLILCARAQPIAFHPTTINSEDFPIALYLYRFRLRITKLNDSDHLDDNYMDPEAEPRSVGILLKERLPEFLPQFPIYTRAGKESVAVEFCAQIEVDEELFKLCADFNTYLFRDVLRIPSMLYNTNEVPIVTIVGPDGKLDVNLIQPPESDGVIPADISLANAEKLLRNAVVNVEATETLPNAHEKRCYVERVFAKADGEVMLVLKRVQKRLEMIHPRHEDRLGNISRKTKQKKAHKLAPRRAVKCVVERLPGSVWNKVASVPSILYRVRRLAAVESLRLDIVTVTGLGHVTPPREGSDAAPSWKPLEMERMAGHRRAQLNVDDDTIRNMNFSKQPELDACCGPSPVDMMKALTPLHANDIVDSERLEVIGDSFLKIAVTLHLYQEFEKANEGELTGKRCRIISNINLLQHAVPKKIHEHVECTSFRVRVNFIPPSAREVAPLKGAAVKAEIAELPRGSQYYKSKICADSIEALIGVYLERCGPAGALEFLRWLDIPLGRRSTGDFLDRFDLPIPNALPQGNMEDLVRWESEMHTAEQAMQYKFTNRLLLLEAITHKSYRYNHLTTSYERLEFLGDAVVDYLISQFIYTSDPDLNPGQLTDVRASLVCNNTLAAIIVDNKLHTVMQHHSPLLLKLTNRFVEYRETEKRINLLDYLIGDNELGEMELSEDDLEQVDVPKPLGDLMESLMGAVFLDSNKSFDVVWRVLVKLMGADFLRDAIVNVRLNPVRQLGEMFPPDGPGGAVFGPAELRDEGRRTAMKLAVQGREFEATARNKKITKILLAKKALRFFRREKERLDENICLDRWLCSNEAV
ncbi:endoribonuclease Dicer-like [Tropilaelaps mercedesae]|uniref:Endoribonuclease Dicer-like n=1 Tax=Tropilaelaps mercedesae TaxID=418985 RepID=A0A1V9Y167_9ACAR|nr:endoribonuclease Dicer-like [Tropilaelaps mercedesae]